MTDFEKSLNVAQEIALGVANLGGRAYFVGGYVRDLLMNRSTKDIDIEVHGVSDENLCAILDSIGDRICIGESFGIYSLKGLCLDIALPRKERAVGKGHKDFHIEVDPFIGTLAAARRRDFTVNALMKDILSGEVIDHFAGLSDLEAKVLRAVDEQTFREDPLRVYRGAQFAARFGFEIEPATLNLFGQMPLDDLARERIEAELKKAMLTSSHPSIFFEVLKKAGKLKPHFSELYDLIDLKQDPIYHAEGDVWTHTMLTLDAAAECAPQTENPFGFMMAALTHDMGKSVTTEEVDGRIHAYAHEVKGLPIIEGFLKKITGEKRLTEYVLNLAELHMKPGVMAQAGSSIKKTNLLFDSAIDGKALILLGECDSKSSISSKGEGYDKQFLYERLQIYHEYMERPYVMGRDLIEAGLAPSEDFSEILRFAHKLRLAGVDKKSALAQTLGFAKTLEKKVETHETAD